MPVGSRRLWGSHRYAKGAGNLSLLWSSDHALSHLKPTPVQVSLLQLCVRRSACSHIADLAPVQDVHSILLLQGLHDVIEQMPAAGARHSAHPVRAAAVLLRRLFV